MKNNKEKLNKEHYFYYSTQALGYPRSFVHRQYVCIAAAIYQRNCR